jgi:transaldolase
MNIFVESASLDEIRRDFQAGFAGGVVLSESQYSGSASEEGKELIAAIAQEFAIPVCVDVSAVSGDDMYREARELAKISDHIVVQLPLVEDAILTMHRLSLEGVEVCANLVFTPAQAVLAAKAGATTVRVSLNDLDEHGRASADTVNEIRTVLESSQCECDVMAASPANTTQFTECINAGAQILSIRPDVLHSLLLHPLTDRGIDRFLNNLARRPKAH